LLADMVNAVCKIDL